MFVHAAGPLAMEAAGPFAFTAMAKTVPAHTREPGMARAAGATEAAPVTATTAAAEPAATVATTEAAMTSWMAGQRETVGVSRPNARANAPPQPSQLFVSRVLQATGAQGFFWGFGRLSPARSLAACPCSKSILRP